MKSRPPQNSSLFQFLQLMQLAGKESDSRALKALKLLQLDESHQKSPFVQSVMKELTQTIAANSTAGENPNPYRHQINHEDAHGPLELGQVIYDFNQPMSNQPVYSLYPIELTCPNLIAGSTGSGKTNLGIYGIAGEIHNFNQKFNLTGDERIGCFFIQTVKLDESYLYNINQDIIFLDSDSLKINPLHHLKHDKEEVFQRFTKLAGEVFFFREGSANQISTLLEKLDKQHNGRPFSVYELYEEIKKLPRTRYEGVLENRFAGLLSNKSGKIFDCLKGLPLEKLAHEFVIINLTDLDFYSQQFIAVYIYQYLTQHFKNQQTPRLNTAIFYDEGDHIFSKHAEQAMMGYPTASSLFTTSRSSGVGAVVITHQPHLVLSSLRSEAYTKIIFNLSDAEDARYMGQACSLSREEQEMIAKLPNYHAIISTRRIQRPFIIKAFNKADEIRKNPVILKPEARQKIAELQEQVIPRETGGKGTNPRHDDPFPFDVDAMLLLKSAWEQPFQSTVGHYEQLEFAASKGNKALKKLEKKGLVNKVRLKTKKGRGGTSSFLEITGEGHKALGKKKQYPGKGSLRHAFYQHLAAEHYERQGCQTRIEYKNCDVAVITPDGNLIGIEVCVHASNAGDRINKDIEMGFEKIILLFESKETMEKTRKNIKAPENVEFKLIDDYLE